MHFWRKAALYGKLTRAIILHCVKFQPKRIRNIEMRAKSVRQKMQKKACFRGQLFKTPSQTAFFLFDGFCIYFYVSYSFGLKLYTLKDNVPGQLPI